MAEATNRRFFGDGKTPYNPPKEHRSSDRFRFARNFGFSSSVRRDAPLLAAFFLDSPLREILLFSRYFFR
jgi:hypothetical protein